MKRKQATPQGTWVNAEVLRYAIDRSLILTAVRELATVIVGGCLMGGAVVALAILEFLPAHYWTPSFASYLTLVAGAVWVWSGLRTLRKTSAALLTPPAAVETVES